MVFKQGNRLWKLRKPFIPWNRKDIDIELMKKLYYEDKKDFKEIADFFGFKSKSAIYDRFKEHRLKARDNTDNKTGFKFKEKSKRKITISLKTAWKDGKFAKRILTSVAGSKNPMWKGGKIKDSKGYFLINSPQHPFASKRGYVREQRLIMEKKINRFLTKKEVVHHIDKNITNNHPDNLMLMPSQKEHLRLHNLSRSKKRQK
jgi:predicted DNA-binding protein YlxM (UPF0122 family)